MNATNNKGQSMRLLVITALLSVLLLTSCSTASSATDDDCGDMYSRAVVMLMRPVGSYNDPYCRDLDNPADCCPDGFSWIGFDIETQVVCLED